MMKRTLAMVLILNLLVVGFGGVTVSAAQTGEPPLIFMMDGDLWSWNGQALTQLTTWGHNERPVVSPNGRYFAYNSVARFVVEQGRGYAGDPPSNIWVGDVFAPNSDGYFRVADQPANAGYNPDGSIRGVLRSTPAWSPDGNRLAWSEVVLPGYVYRIAGYNFTTGAYEIIVPSLPTPFNDAGIRTLNVWWGMPGIAVQILRFTAQTTAAPNNEIWFFDPNGAPLSVVELGNPYGIAFGWVSYSNRDAIGVVYYDTAQVALADPHAGAALAVIGWPELVNANSLSAAYAMPSLKPSGAVAFDWVAVYPDGVRTQALGLGADLYLAHRVGMPPASHGVAFIRDAVYLWRNGQLTRIPGTQGVADDFEAGLAWGYLRWRIRQGGATGVTCPGFLPSRLAVGGRGRVIPGTSPNRIRRDPATTSPIVGQIPAGGVFSVNSGPACAESKAWWLVNYRNIIGWTAEGEGATYWLEPAP